MNSGGAETHRLANAITAHMAAAGITRNRLADLTGIPRTTITRRLTGATNITVAELDRIAQALGVNPVDLYTAGRAA